MPEISARDTGKTPTLKSVSSSAGAGKLLNSLALQAMSSWAQLLNSTVVAQKQP